MAPFFRTRCRSQLSLAHIAKVKTDMAENNEKTAGVHEVSPVGGKLEELWRKGFVEKMSFEPGVEERRSNGW